MCGIGGIIFKKSEATFPDGKLEHYLDLMGQKISHRGPDNQSVALFKTGGFVHRRLSIIDLNARSHQPMETEKGSLITYNGEIYNFEKLKIPGYKYETFSDTEVLLSCFEGRSFDLNSLNGMFAFGFYDRTTDSVTLARDAYGIKPLYYVETDDLVAFSSEIKSLLVLDFINFSINDEAVSDYLSLGYLYGENTGVKEIKALKPGNRLNIADGKAVLCKYKIDSQINFQPCENLYSEFDNLLSKATEARLMGDVPLSVYLSGGIDSSAMAFTLKNKKGIDFVSMDLKGEHYSEVSKAASVANFLNLKLRVHHQRTLKEEDLFKVVYHSDDLICDPAMLSNYILYEVTSKDFKVGLSGDGADELFLGYHTHMASFLNSKMNYKAVGQALGAIGYMLGAFPYSAHKYKWSEKLQRYGSQSHNKFPINHLLWRSPNIPADIIKVKGSLDLDFDLDKEQSLFQTLTALDFQTYLEGNILKKVDRMSMAFSHEVRVPYLDREIVEFSRKLPSSLKMNMFQQKIFLKNYLRDKVPASIQSQPKKGFGLDLKNVLNQIKYKELLLDTFPSFHQFIDRRKLESSLSNLSPYQVFAILVLRIWVERIFKTREA